MKSVLCPLVLSPRWAGRHHCNASVLIRPHRAYLEGVRAGIVQAQVDAERPVAVGRVTFQSGSRMAQAHGWFLATGYVEVTADRGGIAGDIYRATDDVIADTQAAYRASHFSGTDRATIQRRSIKGYGNRGDIDAAGSVISMPRNFRGAVVNGSDDITFSLLARSCPVLLMLSAWLPGCPAASLE